MSDSDEERIDLGGLICDAADENDATVAENIIRSGDFIVFQQIDVDNPDVDPEEDTFSVVLAEIDEETAVVCFSNESAAANFADEIAEELPEGTDLPSVLLSGAALLDGLPTECGLLVNPGSEIECYFPPGCLGLVEE